MVYEDLLKISPYSLKPEEKLPLFKKALQTSLLHHYHNCLPYKKLCQKRSFNPDNPFELADIPFIPAELFKQLPLQSVNSSEIIRVLQSSSTSSQTPSSVHVDNLTRNRQIKTLAWILSDHIGKERHPFIIMDVDPNNIRHDETTISARTAAIRGFLTAASSADYCMEQHASDSLTININKFQNLLLKAQEEKKRIIIFGYTYVLYSNVVKQLQRANIQFKLPDAMILHIGGWKKLQSEAVTEEVFNQALNDVFGIPTHQVMDIYGFTEQLGLIYINHGEELKRCPIASEILIRDPISLNPLPDGEEGLIEFISPLAHSYPGVAILLNDIGKIISRDRSPCGRYGTAFKVIGRAKEAELRGCGDVMAEAL